MRINFSKMHGLGNDFVVIDGINQSIHLSTKQIRYIADRRHGVGCDQLLLVEHSDRSDVDFRYRIFNCDGAEVQQCGNGARCFVRFVIDHGLTDKHEITVETNSGIISIKLEDDGMVTVDMGVPQWQPERIPFLADCQQSRYLIEVDGKNLEFGVVSMGNPHAVLLVEDINTAPVEELGSIITRHAMFPEGVNVGFMQVIDKESIYLRVFERGVGETQACGSGACAAAVIGRHWDLLQQRVNVKLPGGQLCIQWAGGSNNVLMTGPAESVFEGCIDL